jgi:hypothetical protein
MDLLWWWIASLGSGGSFGFWLSLHLDLVGFEEAVSSGSLEFSWSASVGSHLLDEMEFVSLHGDVLTEVFVSVHTGSEVDG